MARHSAAERSHPTSEVRGRSREDPMPEGQRPRGVTPRPRSGAAAESTRLQWRSYPVSEVGGAAERRYPASEVRGCGREELPQAPTPEVRGSGREETPHVPKPEAKGGGGEEQPHN